MVPVQDAKRDIKASISDLSVPVCKEIWILFVLSPLLVAQFLLKSTFLDQNSGQWASFGLQKESNFT
jgi:hypothetical protein